MVDTGLSGEVTTQHPGRVTTSRRRPSRPQRFVRGVTEAVHLHRARTAWHAVPLRPTGLEQFWPSRRAPAYSELCR